MMVRLPEVVRVKATDAGGLGFSQVPSRCVVELQRRTLDARLVHRRHHYHLLLNPMTRMRMRMRIKTGTETTLWLVVLSRAPPP